MFLERNYIKVDLELHCRPQYWPNIGQSPILLVLKTFIYFRIILVDAVEFLSLQVPHSLALLEQHNLVCIADREDMRVVCRGAELSDDGKPQAPLTVQQPDLGRVYAITNHGTFGRDDDKRKGC